MTDLIWAMIFGPLMWIPGLNIFIGWLEGGWKGAVLGIALTVLLSGGGANSETVRETVKTKAREWWQILGVSPTASEDDIKRAYRSKVKEAHPDHGGSDDAMKEINAAREAARKRAQA